MSELTLINLGVECKNNMATVSSRYIAMTFSKEHKTVLRAIENSECSNEFRRCNFVQSYYKNEQNKKQPEYILTRDGFTFIAMGFTGKKAAKFKEDYIKAFNQMESFIKELLEAKEEFPEFTDAILASHEEPKPYHFSNEINMINSIVLGMNTKQFKEVNGIGKVPSIRPYLSSEQITAVKTLQRIDIGLVIAIPDYQQRKSILQQHFNRMQAKLSA